MAGHLGSTCYHLRCCKPGDDRVVDKKKPIIYGAIVGALLGGLPPCCCLNIFCCLPLALGGMVAGGSYASSAAKAGLFPDLGPGALVGLIAGGIAGALSAILQGILQILMMIAGVDPAQALEGLQDLPDDLREQLLEAAEQANPLAEMLINIPIYSVAGLMVGALGGLLGVALFRKPPHVPPAHSTTPTPPAPPAPTGWSDNDAGPTTTRGT